MESTGCECSNLPGVKLEYLRDRSLERPLIRLYEFDQSEARQLRELVKSLATGVRQDVAINRELSHRAAGIPACEQLCHPQFLP